MISLNSINGDLNITRFPDGTPSIHIPAEYALGNPQKPSRTTARAMQAAQRPVNITWNYDSDAELFTLICLTRKLQDLGFDDIVLIMPYIPNARMDRTKNPDEVFTLKYFAEIINSLHFSRVIVLDAHSNVSLALIDRVSCVSPKHNIKFVMDKYLDHENITLFFPDEGAAKRYADMAESLGLPYVFGIKNRDWKTGEILNLSLAGQTDEIKDKDILIIDDICSRGKTFYHSAKALKSAGAADIYLYVSHCENIVLDGSMIKSGLIKHIYTTDSIFRNSHELITLI